MTSRIVATSSEVAKECTDVFEFKASCDPLSCKGFCCYHDFCQLGTGSGVPTETEHSASRSFRQVVKCGKRNNKRRLLQEELTLRLKVPPTLKHYVILYLGSVNDDHRLTECV